MNDPDSSDLRQAFQHWRAQEPEAAPAFPGLNASLPEAWPRRLPAWSLATAAGIIVAGLVLMPRPSAPTLAQAAPRPLLQPAVPGGFSLNGPEPLLRSGTPSDFLLPDSTHPPPAIRQPTKRFLFSLILATLPASARNKLPAGRSSCASQSSRPKPFPGTVNNLRSRRIRKPNSKNSSKKPRRNPPPSRPPSKKNAHGWKPWCKTHPPRSTKRRPSSTRFSKPKAPSNVCNSAPCSA